jgi:hypothetical protein
MHDRLRVGADDGCLQRLCIERVGHHRLCAGSPQRLHLLWCARHACDLVAAGHEHRHQTPAEHAAGAGDEDSHAGASLAASPAALRHSQASSTVRMASEKKSK